MGRVGSGRGGDGASEESGGGEARATRDLRGQMKKERSKGWKLKKTPTTLGDSTARLNL